MMCRRTKSFFYLRMHFVCLLSILLIVHVNSDNHENSNGPFGKHHSIQNVPSPYGCNRTLGRSVASMPSSTVINITRLDVSTTFYVSNEEILLTWNSTGFACQDDFIGIYFSEIPILSG